MTYMEVAKAFLEYSVDDGHLTEIVDVINTNYGKGKMEEAVAEILKDRIETL